jgi:hypothetical protein
MISFRGTNKRQRTQEFRLIVGDKDFGAIRHF